MPMEERREMDLVTDAHRVAWLQHGLLVLLQIHPVRLHLDGDAAVHRPTTEDICYYLGCHLTSSKATRNLGRGRGPTPPTCRGRRRCGPVPSPALHGEEGVHRDGYDDDDGAAWRSQQFVDAFTLKKEVAKGVDVMVVRELNGGRLEVTEIFNFSQDDLLTEDMMILDTHGEVFIWIGQYVESKEKQKAFDIGQAYHRWDASAGREDVETLAQCQRMIACGEWPPLAVAYDHVEGSTMEAGGILGASLILWVLVPHMMAVTESSRFHESLKKDDVHIRRLIINQVLPLSASFCRFCAAKWRVTEIFNFSQDDLLTEDMMILDTHGEVFIWIGQYVESKEKQKAFDIG
ncbi:Lipid phosphate phosphatase delta [Zea mays]|uniref:Lipid phosphate phosphatase delta n=1 Tax=Zea mays TaxID=4577 RepID=A0A1D6MWR1_MAIZE|nr:Lipid phosphate phosphatase delta [Zea mays]